ncbi:hypothetical protein ACWEH1_30710 [Micromonospora chersina]
MPPSHRAFTILSALLLAGSTSCTGHDAAPTSPARPAQSASAAPTQLTTEASRVLSIPPVTSNEISRVVYTAKTHNTDSVVRAEARTGQLYALDAACTSATPGRVIKYEVLSSKPDSNVPVASGELPCDGNVMRNSTPLPATAIQTASDLI